MHNEILTKKEKVFLTNYFPKTTNFYSLPKKRKSLNTLKFQTQVTSNLDLY